MTPAFRFTQMDNIRSTIKEVIRLLSYLVDEDSETFGSWLRKWYVLYKKDRLKDRTVKDLERYIEDRIIPRLGQIRLSDLDGAELQAFVSSIERGNTRKKISFVLNASLRKAVALRKILFNPFDSVEVPGYRKGHYRAIEFDEQNVIWNYYLNPVAYNNYLNVEPMKAVFFFMCCTGMRIGEFLALDFKKDVDRRKRLIRIYKSMDNKRLRIFSANIHSFRHTFVSMCYRAGIRDKYIQLYVGHSDITTTMNIYTHGMARGTSPLFEYILDLAEYLQSLQRR